MHSEASLCAWGWGDGHPGFPCRLDMVLHYVMVRSWIRIVAQKITTSEKWSKKIDEIPKLRLDGLNPHNDLTEDRCTYVYRQTKKRIYVCTYIHISIYMHTHLYICICIYIRIYICMYLLLRTCRTRLIYICVHIYIYMHLYNYSYILWRRNVSTYMCVYMCSPRLCYFGCSVLVPDESSRLSSRQTAFMVIILAARPTSYDLFSVWSWAFVELKWLEFHSLMHSVCRHFNLIC